MRLPLITGWLSSCRTRSLSLNAQMQEASISIKAGRTCQCVPMHRPWQAHIARRPADPRRRRQTEGFDKWRRHCLDGGRGVVVGYGGCGGGVLWQSECPRHRWHAVCGLLHVTSGEARQVVPETSGTYVASQENGEKWQSEGPCRTMCEIDAAACRRALNPDFLTSDLLDKEMVWQVFPKINCLRLNLIFNK